MIKSKTIMKKLLLLALVVIGGVMQANAGTKTIYFDASAVSGADHYAIYYFAASDDSNGWENFTQVSGNFYKVSYDDKYEKVIICRMNQGDNNWSNRANQSNDLTDIADGAYYRSTGYYGDDQPQKVSLDVSYPTINSSWCVVDDGTLTGNSWTTKTTYMTYNSETGLMEKNFEGVDLSEGTFKVKTCLGNWVESYGDASNSDSQNKEVTVPATGKYNVKVTFNIGTKSNIDVTLTQIEKVTISTSGFATLTSTYALDFTDTGIKAYTATDNENGSATLVTATTPAASTPLLLKADEGTYYVPVATTGDSNPTNNALQPGTGSSLATESVSGYYNYILNSGEFFWANNQTVGTNKAYLQLKKTSAARVSLIFPEEEVSAINNMETTDKNNAAYYNLQGVKIYQPTKGLYIRNGKKFIVK